MTEFIIDPSLAEKGQDTTEQEVIRQSSHLWYFQQCEANRELLKSIEVVVPVRPADGMNCHLSRMLSIWYGEGTGWSQLNDHMGGFIEMTRANICYDFVKRKRPMPTKFLIMIDNDMEPPINLPYLLARHDKPLVGSVAMHVHPEEGPRACFTVKCPDGEYRWPEMRKHVLPQRGLLKAGHVGTGAVCIRRDVLESFSFEGEDIPFYVPEDVRQAGARIGRLILGEDLAFCEQIRKRGFECHIDMEALCGHRKTVCMNWDQERLDPNLDAATFLLPSDGRPAGRR